MYDRAKKCGRTKPRVGAIKLTKKYVHACARKRGKEGRREEARTPQKHVACVCDEAQS